MKILVTGGAGFIGSAVCRYVIESTDHEIINIDALTYAIDPAALESIAHHPRYIFEHADIRDAQKIENIFKKQKPDMVMHLAAETHVDRSIDAPGIFIETNITGTYNMLQATRNYWCALPDSAKKNFRFHHVSTDEVYGASGEGGAFTENSLYAPNSPYSASKAAADHLVRAWHITFGLPVVISHCSNNYGPYQFPEKFIPLLILNALEGHSLPIYGDGGNIRDWLHVDDHAQALYLILMKGRIGEKYNVGSNAEMRNIDLARAVCKIMNELRPGGAPYERLISFVPDRPGHDFRYALDCTKLKNELGWIPQETLESGLRKTVQWYLDHYAAAPLRKVSRA